MTGDVGDEHGDTTLVEQKKVIKIARHLRHRPVRRGQAETRQLRQGTRKNRSLDQPCRGEFILHYGEPLFP